MILCLIPAVLLLLAIADMPSGYYVIMRIIVCFVSSVIAYSEFRKARVNLSVIVFGVMAIVFNPIIPVYLYDRDIWTPIDISGAIAFIIKGFAIRR